MFSDSDPLSGQPTVTEPSAQLAAMVLRISAVVYLLLASPGIGAATGDRGEDRLALPAVQSQLCRSQATRARHLPRIVTVHKACTPAKASLSLRLEALDRPDAGCRTSSPIVFSRTSPPLTEALHDDRPPQVRVEVRRWRTAILASGGRAPLSGRLQERQSVSGASRRDDPSHSLHELFCTWVI